MKIRSLSIAVAIFSALVGLGTVGFAQASEGLSSLAKPFPRCGRSDSEFFY